MNTNLKKIKKKIKKIGHKLARHNIFLHTQSNTLVHLQQARPPLNPFLQHRHPISFLFFFFFFFYFFPGFFSFFLVFFFFFFWNERTVRRRRSFSYIRTALALLLVVQ